MLPTPFLQGLSFDFLSSRQNLLGSPEVDVRRRHVVQARLAEAEATLKRAVAEVDDVPSEIHTVLMEGSPAESIINLARTWDSNLIVMGSRGRSVIAELVLGGSSQKVVSHAPCPVLIVR